MENVPNPFFDVSQQVREVKVKKEQQDALPTNDGDIKVEDDGRDVTPPAVRADTKPDDAECAALLERHEPTWTVEPYRNRHVWRYFLLTPDTCADSDKPPDAEARSVITVKHEIEVKGAEETLIVNQWEAPLSGAPHELSSKKRIRRNRWDEPPKTECGNGADGVLPEKSPPPKTRRTRWDQPVADTIRMRNAATHCENYTPPIPGISTYSVSHNLMRTTAIMPLAEPSRNNRPMADEELETIFPSGYKLLTPPSNYNLIRALNLGTGTPTDFFMRTEQTKPTFENVQPKRNLPLMKQDDVQFFGKLLNDVDECSLTAAELKERQIMGLLLKVKNGDPLIRKIAMRRITNKAREFGAGPLFNQILPIMASTTLEDHERHQLVKVINRILFKLDDLVRPYVHRILVVIEPLLIDEDLYARVEGREVISNLTKAAGLATMLSTMRPDIDSPEEYVRDTTSRAVAVVASTLGVSLLLPFLQAVCKSNKSWQTRHTGFKIVQQTAILMGNAILSHLSLLVELVGSGLVDRYPNNRIMSALAIAALAEASTPYGIESFDTVLKPLWLSVQSCQGKVLASFLKAIGCLIPLMETSFASYYTREIMPVMIREFQSPDSEMKCIVLKVVKQCCTVEGLGAWYVKQELLPPFIKHFWTCGILLNVRYNRQLTDTTVDLASKVGTYDILNRLVDHLKDESEPVRQMGMVTISKIMEHAGAAEIDSQLEEQLVDGILYTFQEQSYSDRTILIAFRTIVFQLGKRFKPYLAQISSVILLRLNSRCSFTRQQSADLISYAAAVIKLCGDLQLLKHLAVVLCGCLGEEYPEVLGSILGALKTILNVMDASIVTPLLKALLLRLLPIMKNRHEKVQQNCVGLVGLIAQLAPGHVSARDWMRVCFELLELLKSHSKSVRRIAIVTFGYIARAIGPHDIMVMLLNSLKVQQRKNRVCSTVAIAVLAKTCHPFTVLPILVNEYRVREQNVRNGVLMSLSFMFQYIGEMAKDYVYAVSPLLEVALKDRELVQRQLACGTMKHIALGVNGMGCDDVLIHLMNYVWPNIFETKPHLWLTFREAIDALRVALGPTKILQYLLQGMFHASRKVRAAYWKIYNMLYVGSQDALVLGYPRIVNDSRNCYVRYELEYNL